MSEAAFLVARRLADLAEIVAGSKLDHCSRCDAPVMMARSSYSILAANPGLEMICQHCADAELRASGEEMKLVAPTAEQLREIVAEKKNRQG